MDGSISNKVSLSYTINSKDDIKIGVSSNASKNKLTSKDVVYYDEVVLDLVRKDRRISLFLKVTINDGISNSARNLVQDIYNLHKICRVL